MTNDDKPGTERSSSPRTVLVRMVFVTDASELDIAQAAGAFAEGLKILGARIEEGGVITSHAPTEKAAKKLWANPQRSIRDFADAWEAHDGPIPDTCPECGGRNHPAEQAWMEENLPRIAARIKRGGKCSIAERKLLSASHRLVIVQNQLGTLCGSQVGQRAKDDLAAAARALMTNGDKAS